MWHTQGVAPPRSSTHMTEYRLSCRAQLSLVAIERLDQVGIYRTRGAAPFWARPERRTHDLVVRASSEEQALRIAREAVASAGGDASDIECHGPVGSLKHSA